MVQRLRRQQTSQTARTFIPSVLHTRSEMADTWLLWKWSATKNSISPNDVVLPPSLTDSKVYIIISNRDNKVDIIIPKSQQHNYK